ncbi:MAG: UDP-N-acetylmuramoyl-L-alanyl-D-glutamate--2,6-diaminopimelate ligase, partial [Myxococcales bacterium]|nr:UDP-N-acetylmuramoyl-L-alanyl-D-glutamate--2,6-diaminopimelate ligase [Myxococcales bacterium]
GRLIVVFGCGGDRDTTKRGPMGLAAGERADVVIVTSDNPRSEDPELIVQAVASGVLEAGKAPISAEDLTSADAGLVTIVDRKRAIFEAISAARPGDIVLLAGKGHEDYQILGNEKRHFDDREEARAALAVRRARGTRRD